MYKLLTTAAVIMTVATPSFAWTDAEKLIQKSKQYLYKLRWCKLNSILQTYRRTNSRWELTTFLSDVSKGVTHLSNVNS